MEVTGILPILLVDPEVMFKLLPPHLFRRLDSLHSRSLLLLHEAGRALKATGCKSIHWLSAEGHRPKLHRR